MMGQKKLEIFLVKIRCLAKQFLEVAYSISHIALIFSFLSTIRVIMYVFSSCYVSKKRPREIVATRGLIVMKTSCLLQKNEEAVYNVARKSIPSCFKCSFLELCS